MYKECSGSSGNGRLEEEVVDVREGESVELEFGEAVGDELLLQA